MYDDDLKIIIFGDKFPGKTAFTQKFLTNLYVPDQTMTIGVDFVVKSLIVDGRKVKLKIWEFGGEERFRFLLPTYVRGARGGLFLYDVTKYSSIAHIDDWLSVIRKEIRAEKMFPILVVGIVPDERIEREVSGKDGIKIAKSRNVNGYIECNLKTGKNVEKVFEALTRLMLADKGFDDKSEEKKGRNKRYLRTKERRKKEEAKDEEYLITYTRHLEKRLRNLETEKQLLNAERLRLEQLVNTLRNEIDRYKNT